MFDISEKLLIHFTETLEIRFSLVLDYFFSIIYDTSDKTSSSVFGSIAVTRNFKDKSG
jgi:hypothetical protein